MEKERESCKVVTEELEERLTYVIEGKGISKGREGASQRIPRYESLEVFVYRPKLPMKTTDLTNPLSSALQHSAPDPIRSITLHTGAGSLGELKQTTRKQSPDAALTQINLSLPKYRNSLQLLLAALNMYVMTFRASDASALTK